MRQSLDEISPSTYLDRPTRLYLMHDVGDTFIPFTESRASGRRRAPRHRPALHGVLDLLRM